MWGSKFDKCVDGCQDLQRLVGELQAHVGFFTVQLNRLECEIVFLSLFGLMVALRYLGSQPPLQSVDTPVFCEHPLSWGVLISVDFTPLVISIGVRCTVRNLGPSFCAMMHRVVLFVLS